MHIPSHYSPLTSHFSHLFFVTLSKPIFCHTEPVEVQSKYRIASKLLLNKRLRPFDMLRTGSAQTDNPFAILTSHLSPLTPHASRLR